MNYKKVNNSVNGISLFANVGIDETYFKTLLTTMPK